jgi:hypothetical protein
LAIVAGHGRARVHVDATTRPNSPTDASGRPNPMSAVSMTSPPTRRDTAGHHGPHEGRLRLGTPPTLVPSEKPPPVVDLRWMG